MPRTYLSLLAALTVAATSTLPRAAFALTTSANLIVGPVAARLKRINTIAPTTTAASVNIIYGAAAPGSNKLFLVQQGTTDGTPDTISKLLSIDPTVVDAAPTPIINFQTALPNMLDTTQFEKGFLGVAFHPDFNKPGTPGYLKFYTYTNETVASHTGETFDFLHPEIASQANPGSFLSNIAVLREWTANSTTPTGITGTSRVVLKYADPQNQHNGGTLAFSPTDGYLYWALGDGGGNSSTSPDCVTSLNNPTDGHTNSPDGIAPHGNGQDRTVPFGKMLRINPLPESAFDDPNAVPSVNGQYQIPVDNPFTMASNIDPNTSAPYANWNTNWLDEIYAYGLRNPYRFSFDAGAALDDPNRGKLYVADAGYDQREEVDTIQPGGNYGWVIKEGTRNMAGVLIGGVPIPSYTAPVNAQTGLPDTLIDPIAEYDHTVGVATIGGFIYRGWKESSLYGKYIFGDNNATISGIDAIIMYLDPNEVKAPNAPYTIYRLGISPLGASIPSGNGGLLGFGQGADGLIYAMLDNGQVYAINPLFTADFDHDGDVDAADLNVWKGAFGLTAAGDANGDGASDGSDFALWQQQLGSGVGSPPISAVPEPATRLLVVAACAALLGRRRGRGIR